MAGDLKYVVFKADEWNAWAAKVADDPVAREGLPRDPTPLEDCVVIRLKDPFAATALYTYANTIMSLVELMEQWIDPQEHHRMIEVADYFQAQAIRSGTIGDKRLPD